MLEQFRTTYIPWDMANKNFHETIELSSSDEQGRRIVVHVLDRGQVVDLTGAGLNLYWETPDKHYMGLDNFEALDIRKGKFGLYVTTEMLSHIGKLNGLLYIVDMEGKAITSLRLEFRVHSGINAEAIESQNSFSALTDAFGRLVGIETDELLRKQAEQDRVDAELLREQAEQQRASAFNSSQTSRQNMYQVAEAERDNSYEQAETARDNEYAPRLEEVERKAEEGILASNATGYYTSDSFEKDTDFNAHYFRVPAGARLNNGTIVSFAQVQYTENSDFAHQEVAMSASKDEGRTWTDKKVVVSATNNNSRVMNPTVIYDADTNKILLFTTEFLNTDSSTPWHKTPDNQWNTYLSVSDDNGNTWTTTSIKNTLINSRKTNWGICMPGLGTGLKRSDGKYILAFEVGYDNGSTHHILNVLAHSTDLINWTFTNEVDALGDEANIVQLDNGDIMLNVRNYQTNAPKMRKIYVTSDLGATWDEHPTSNTIPENRATMGHTLNIEIEGVSHVVFSHMQSEKWDRKKLGVSVLNDNEDEWHIADVVEKEPYDGYSFLLYNEHIPSQLHVLYEKDGNIICKNISYLLPTVKSLTKVPRTKQSYVNLEMTTEKNIATKVAHKLAYDVINYSDGYRPLRVSVNGDITVLESGMYSFEIMFGIHGVSSGGFVHQVDLKKNGNFEKRVGYGEYSGVAGYASVNYSDFISKGTVISFEYLCNKSGKLRVPGYNFATIRKVS